MTNINELTSEELIMYIKNCTDVTNILICDHAKQMMQLKREFILLQKMMLTISKGVQLLSERQDKHADFLLNLKRSD